MAARASAVRVAATAPSADVRLDADAAGLHAALNELVRV
jgi:hypothetical protein